MRSFAWTAAFAAMGGLVIACGTNTSSSAGSTSASSSSGGDPAAALLDMYCHTVAEAFCQADFACCSVPFGADTVASCEDAVLLGSTMFCGNPWERDALHAALQSGAVVFDQAQFETCLALLRSTVSGGAACVYPPQYLFFSTCIGAFQGKIAPDDACPWPATSDLDRALVCMDGTCEDGTCIPFLKIGDPCLLSPYAPLELPVTTRCNYMKHEGCWGIVPDAGAGGGGGAGGAMPMGTCLPQAEIGEPCDPGNDHECKSLFCNPKTAQCGPASEGGGCTRN